MPGLVGLTFAYPLPVCDTWTAGCVLGRRVPTVLPDAHAELPVRILVPNHRGWLQRYALQHGCNGLPDTHPGLPSTYCGLRAGLPVLRRNAGWLLRLTRLLPGGLCRMPALVQVPPGP